MNNIIQGNALEINGLLKQKYRTIITSPPYFKQRVYGNDLNEIGNEKNLDEYLKKLTSVFEQCLKYLEEDGSLWIVIGDVRKQGDKLRVANKLVDCLENIGYFFKEDIIWYKKNSISSSAKNNFSSVYEHILYFSKSKHPFTNLDDIRIPGNEAKEGRNKTPPSNMLQFKPVNADPIKIKEITNYIHACSPNTPIESLPSTSEIAKSYGYDPEKYCPTCYRKMKRHATRRRFGGHKHYPIFAACNPKGKNPGNVWEIPTKAHYGNEHFAIFPEDLVEKILKFSTMKNDHVLDPFMGRGTTGIVCKSLHRNFTGVDLYAKNVEISTNNVISKITYQ